jgi:hypothetical protein
LAGFAAFELLLALEQAADVGPGAMTIRPDRPDERPTFDPDHLAV